jgi:hypothetical protein
MSDDLKNRGQQDRGRVEGDEKWELAYMREKYNVSTELIQEAVKQVGNDRRKVEEFLERKR